MQFFVTLKYVSAICYPIPTNYNISPAFGTDVLSNARGHIFKIHFTLNIINYASSG
jgi:hypothetical protein